MKKKAFEVTRFEVLQASKDDTLKGGFSLAYSRGRGSSESFAVNPWCTVSNNCHGGNCVSGCGAQKQSS